MRNSLRNVLYVCLFVCLAALVAFAPAAAWGQAAATGTIVGSVVDNTNAVVPGATITIMLTTTGTTRTTTSDNQGRFVFADVQPGAYTVNVSKQGFSATVITNQTVKVGTQLNENVKMQVGAISTTVTVTENPGAELQTMDATVGSTLSGTIINSLPNVGRDVSTLAIFQPGQSINGATGGVETDQNSFQLDGGYATDDMSGDNNTYIASFSSDTAGGSGAMHSQGFNQAPSAVVPIPVSSVEEFKVSTANQSADFNGGAGSQMQIVTKRGTNTFHGTAYDYYLDNNFGGANTWDNNSTGFKQASSHFSRFGAAAGGKIPHSDFLGGSWYIFGNYEGFRFPQGSTFERSYPSPSLAAGFIHINPKLGDGSVEVINLNTTDMLDPALAGAGPLFPHNTATIVAVDGTTLTNDPCPNGPCDPRAAGPNSVIQTLWSTYLPAPNDYATHTDGFVPICSDTTNPICTGQTNALYSTKAMTANDGGFKGAIHTPQKSNFGVARIDHDFSKTEHFNGTYHYYKLTHTVSDQTDIGGFFPGDVKGTYTAIRQKPQAPWIYTAGLTTDVSSNMTNDFHFSYTRNWWAYLDPSGVPNVAGYPAALEIRGETSGSFQPYNTNNQSTRFRYWNGHDYNLRDDVTWIKGNHLFQFGGSWLRNRDTHLRNDNGQSINTFEQYLIGACTNSACFGANFAPFRPGSIAGSNKTTYENYYSMILGIVNNTQSLYTRGIGSQITGLPLNPRPAGDCALASVPATSGCTNSPPMTNSSIIPTYNAYLTDSWHMKPNFSLNYGLGYTVEMPPYETLGGFQTVMVDANNNVLSAANYLNNERQAALQGLAYAPLIGFSITRNANGTGTSHYPYNPYFGGMSPRVGFAWNFRPDTVVRAGYARIFGRINGVNPILVPMLTPGLMQPATCGGPQNSSGNSACLTPTSITDPNTAFRVGLDGVNAPLPPPTANLPQPWYPGFNDVATGAGETIDPNFHPDRSDEFTVSVQHQFGPKILAEAGYIGRMLGNEVQYYSLDNVPYMMTQGGQTFGQAWKNIMLSTNYGANLPPTKICVANCNTASPTLGPNPAYMPYVNSLAHQSFFESALVPGYCQVTDPVSGNPTPTSCTGAFVVNQAGNMGNSDPYDAWGATSAKGNWTFGRSFPSDPIAATCTATVKIGCSGQTPSITTTISNGFGNYNAGYLQLTFTDWHGLTMKSNFSYSNALGTGNVVQASSSFASVDSFNIRNNYGPQSYNEKFVFNMFLNYAEPFYAGQKGAIGRLLGGWSISPLFVYGSGFPAQIGTVNGNCGTFGECNTNFIGANENAVVAANLHYSGTRKVPSAANSSVCGNSGPFNVFSNPDATCPQNSGLLQDPVRNPILGLDGQIGTFPLKGLPFWNLDAAITKKVNITEKFSGSLYFNFSNVLNHMQAADPCFSTGDQGDWGVLGCGGNVQGNTPRTMQLGFTLDW